MPLPHRRWGWGCQAISRLQLTGDERVLDIGCGTGRDAQRLLDLLPHGRIVAVDGSRQMLAELTARLRDQLDRITILHADLREPLNLPEPADAALSVATLHWLPDHAAVFRHLAAVLRPGGQLVIEAVGAGNVAAVRRALSDVCGDDGSDVWTFATVDDTATRLTAAGFHDVQITLVPDPLQLERGEQLEAFLATVILGAQLRQIPPAERHSFVTSVAQRLPEPVIDYVRLQIHARRG